jgi:hypothetical protein
MDLCTCVNMYDDYGTTYARDLPSEPCCMALVNGGECREKATGLYKGVCTCITLVIAWSVHIYRCDVIPHTV